MPRNQKQTLVENLNNLPVLSALLEISCVDKKSEKQKKKIKFTPVGEGGSGHQASATENT